MGEGEIDVNFNSKVSFQFHTHAHTCAVWFPHPIFSLVTLSLPLRTPSLYSSPSYFHDLLFFLNDTFFLIRVAGMNMGGRLFIEQEQLDTSEDYHFSFHGSHY